MMIMFSANILDIIIRLFELFISKMTQLFDLTYQ